MAMVEFETKGGKKALFNTATIAVVMEETKEGSCCIIYPVDGESWYIKGTIKEVDEKIWRAKRWELLNDDETTGG